MTALEDRLRRELPELADSLASRAEPEQAAHAVTPDAAPSADVRRRRWPLVAAAASVIVLAAFAYGLVSLTDDDGTEVTTSADDIEGALGFDAVEAPATLGTWSVLAEAPIEPRPHAVSAWTGDEAIFWAGSSLDRGFAYTDGAAYDPAADVWRTIEVPGWGHPGLTAVLFDGELYALAKGGGSRFDPTSGVWVDLPPVEGMFLSATVATDDAVWGLGPAGQNPTGQPDLAIARYEPETDSWVYGPIFEGTDSHAAIVNRLAQFESSVHWDGAEIIVWGGAEGGVAFDPSLESWRAFGPPEPTSGVMRGGAATITAGKLTVLAEIETAGETSGSVAVLDGDQWRWLDVTIPARESDSVTLAAAGEWLMALSPSTPPVTVHTPSGTWSRHDEGPLAGVEAPNTVWTGEQLIIWGGVASDAAAPPGVSWSPPDTTPAPGRSIDAAVEPVPVLYAAGTETRPGDVGPETTGLILHAACGTSPNLEAIDYRADEVGITLTGTAPNGDDCTETIEVQLAEPVGERSLFDDVASTTIQDRPSFLNRIVPPPQTPGARTSAALSFESGNDDCRNGGAVEAFGVTWVPAELLPLAWRYQSPMEGTVEIVDDTNALFEAEGTTMRITSGEVQAVCVSWIPDD